MGHMKGTNGVGKMTSVDLVDAGLPQINLLKKKKERKTTTKRRAGAGVRGERLPIEMWIKHLQSGEKKSRR